MLKNILFSTFLLTIFIIFMHGIALTLYLYYALWWLDITMHFLGGAAIAMAFSWIYMHRDQNHDGVPDTELPLYILPVALLSVVLISISWELFEVFAGLTFTYLDGYILDTIIDFCSSLTGGTITYLVLRRMVKRI